MGKEREVKWKEEEDGESEEKELHMLPNGKQPLALTSLNNC